MKLLVIYFMTTVLFPNTSLNAPTFAARYAHGLASLGRYAWPHAIYKLLMGGMPLTTARVQLRCKKSTPR